MTRRNDPRDIYISMATEVFAEHGYRGTSLAAVAAKAGVTKQALLHFFGSKEKLYAAVLDALAKRQNAALDTAQDPDPAQHLLRYVRGVRSGDLLSGTDAALAVRALLDSDPTARVWPLKGYLDTLAALAAATPGGRRHASEDVRAWVLHLVGTLQYLSVSGPTLEGLYGTAAAGAASDQFDRIVETTVRQFIAADPPGSAPAAQVNTSPS